MTLTPLQAEQVREARRIVEARYKYFQDADRTGLAGRLLNSVAQINTNFFHLVFEILQNSDDATYSASCNCPSLTIDISDERFITFEGNQQPFTQRNLESLCNAAESSKRGDASTTGEKGLGFKSIFRICTKVFIKSGPYSFSLGCNGFEMVQPVWTEIEHFPIDISMLPFEGTIIILQLGDFNMLRRSLRQKLRKDIYEIQPEMLLFLRRLRRLNIRYSANEQRQLVKEALSHTQNLFRITAAIACRPTTSSIHGGSWQQRSEGESTYYAVHTYTISDLPHEEKRPGIHSTRLEFAFPFKQSSGGGNNTNLVRTPRIDKVRCFLFATLPLRETHFKFHINCETWVTSANREDIDQDNEWNMHLRDHISDCAIRSIEKFVNKPELLLQLSCLRWLPQAKVKETKAGGASDVIGVDGFDLFLESEALAIVRDIRDREVVLDSAGKLRRPGKCLTIRSEFKYKGSPLVSSEDMRFVHAKYSDDDLPILRNIGCRAFGKSDFLDCIRAFSDDDLQQKVDRHGPDWFGALFKALRHTKGWTAKQLDDLKRLRCVPATKQSTLVLLHPNESGLFMPSQIPELQRALVTLDPSIFFVAVETFATMSDAEEFLVEKLKVQRATVETIGTYLIKQHEFKGFARPITTLRSHLKFFCKNKSELPGLPFDKLILVDEQERCTPLSMLYFDEFALLHDILESSSDIRFIHADLISVDRFRSFLMQHGLAVLPRLSERADMEIALHTQHPLKLIDLLCKLNESRCDLVQTYLDNKDFVTRMKELQVLCVDGQQRALKDTFFQSKELQHEDLPFIQVANVRTKFYRRVLTRLGVSFSPNVQLCIKMLAAASASGSTDLANAKSWYQKLSRPSAGDVTEIVDAFAENKILYLPLSQKWTSLSDDTIFWSTTLTYLVEPCTITLLQSSYATFEALFRKILKVTNLTIVHTPRLLKHLVHGFDPLLTDHPNEQWLNVLDRILDDISRLQRDDPTSKHEFVKELCGLPIYRLRGVDPDIHIVSYNTGDLFIPDDTEAARALVCDKRVRLLRISESDIPLRLHFVKLVNDCDPQHPIKLLSSSIFRDNEAEGELTIDNGRTRDLKRHRRDIARYVYAKESHICAEDAVRKLAVAVVYSASSIRQILRVTTSAGEVQVAGKDPFCMHNYTEQGAFHIIISKSETDAIHEIKYIHNFSTTLQQCLGASDGLREFLKEIWCKDGQKVEQYLADRSIGLLPRELSDIFDRQDDLDFPRQASEEFEGPEPLPVDEEDNDDTDSADPARIKQELLEQQFMTAATRSVFSDSDDDEDGSSRVMGMLERSELNKGTHQSNRRRSSELSEPGAEDDFRPIPYGEVNSRSAELRDGSSPMPQDLPSELDVLVSPNASQARRRSFGDIFREVDTEEPEAPIISPESPRKRRRTPVPEDFTMTYKNPRIEDAIDDCDERSQLKQAILQRIDAIFDSVTNSLATLRIFEADFNRAADATIHDNE